MALVKVATFLRAIVLPVLLILYTGFCCVVALLAVFFIRKRTLENKIVRMWTTGICWMVGIKLNVQGAENIPPGGVLFVFNHQSLLDIPVMHSALPKDFRFGAKTELFRIPLFGRTMTALHALPIARGNRAEAIQVLEEASKRMVNGESFALAPEGTRQKEAAIGEFKTGPFVMAIQAKRPVVPVVIKNIHRIMPRKALLIHKNAWVSEVNVSILKAVDGAQFNFENRDVFRNQVREAMKREYERENTKERIQKREYDSH